MEGDLYICIHTIAGLVKEMSVQININDHQRKVYIDIYTHN
jgi:hypothetical protein